MMTSIRGRVRQTAQVVIAWVTTVDDSPARTYLSSPEYALFTRMSRAERQHHLRVLHDLLEAGHTHPALLKAALLHDVGKTRFRFMLPQKVLVVLVKFFAPQHFTTWGASKPTGWKLPFVVSAQHPAWGAEMCAAIRMEPLAVDLIRRHQDPVTPPPTSEADGLLLLLQAADDRS